MSLREIFTTSRNEDTIDQLERALIDPETRSSLARLEELLHPEFTETSSSGEVYEREAMIEMMLGEQPGDVMLLDLLTTRLAADVAMTTYRSVGASGREARRTSIWVRTENGWQIRHHQGTKVADSWGQIS